MTANGSYFHRIKRFAAGVSPIQLPGKAFAWIHTKFHRRYFSPMAKKMREIRRLEHKIGVDFGGWISQKELGTDPVRSASYEPSFRFGEGIITRFPISHTDSVIDIGCGKGLAMYYLGKFPFGRVDGVEVSQKLCTICRDNFQHLYGQNDRFHVFQADAADFADLDVYNYIYLYNPFREAVMAAFMKNLSDSIARKQRTVRLLYQNPTCNDVVMATGIFKPIGYDGPVLIYDFVPMQ